MRNCSSRVLAIFAIASIAVNALAFRREHKNRVETKVVAHAIPSAVRYEFSRNVGVGRLVLGQEGVPGSISRTYRIVYHGDREVGRDLVRIDRVEPTPTVFLMGRAGYQASRSSAYIRSRVLVMSATAYDNSPRENGGTGYTRMGLRADFGVVAVDPRVIPLGTMVYVEGYGYAIAADTGSAIKGNRIDLCYPSYRVASAFGRKRVKVHILKGR